MPIFVDTSAIFALLDASDLSHDLAEAQWSSLGDVDESLVTTNYVIVETMTLLQRRLGMQAARDFVSQVAPIPSIVWVDEDVHQRGIAAVLASGRRDLSLVDCVSFEVMREAGIDTAFAFDAHFTEQGYRVVP